MEEDKRGRKRGGRKGGGGGGEGAVAARPWAEEGEEGRRGPAPSGVVATTGEVGQGVVAGGEEMKPREKRPLPRRTKRKPPDVSPSRSEGSKVNPDTPGSHQQGSMKDVEAGQRQQEEADAFWKDRRIFNLKESYVANNERLRDEIERLNGLLVERKKEIADLNETASIKERGYLQQNNFLTEMEIHLEKSARESTASRAEAQTEKQRSQISNSVIEQLKKEVASLTSDLADTTRAKHQLEADKDEAEVIIKGLHERIDTLESEAASHEAVATENASLQEQIAEVHASLEDVFSDMSKDLTIDEKFAYVRERQTAAPTGRPRVVSSASLTDELDNLSDTGSERHIVVAPKQHLTFSGISSIETAPVAAPAAVTKSTTLLELSDVSVVETVPISPPAATSVSKPIASFDLSTISSVETPPIAISDATHAVAASKFTAPLTLSSISSIEIAPIAAPVAASKSTAPLGLSDIASVDTHPSSIPSAKARAALMKKYIATEETSPNSDTTPASTKPDKITFGVRKPTRSIATPKGTESKLRQNSASDFEFSGLSGVEEFSIPEPKPTPAPEPAPAVRVKYQTKRVYIPTIVDRPVVPWWMWLLFLIGILACAGGFAGLLREKQIWLDANDLAYQRLMGGHEESWIEWVGFGVEDLLPRMGPSIIGHSLFG